MRPRRVKAREFVEPARNLWRPCEPATREGLRGHLLLLSPCELLTALMAGDGGSTRVTDRVYSKNRPKNGLKVL